MADAGRCDTADHRADIDDAAALADVLEGRLGGQEQAQDIDVEHPVKLFFGKGFDRSELVNPGVVDQNVEPAVVLNGGVDDALGLGGLGDITTDSNGLPPAAVIESTTVFAPDLLDE